MIQLHYEPGAASFTPHVLLRELQLPFTLVPVDRAAGTLDSPAYRALNPNGLMPVLVDGDLVLYETAAICLHLAETHPQAGLLPPVGSAERAHALKWLVWLTNTLQAMLIHYFYPQRMAEDEAGAAQVRRRAEARIGPMLDQLDAQLAASGGPWLLGARYTVADPYAFMLCRWTRNFAHSPPARSRPHVAPFLERVRGRPAAQAAFDAEGLQAPWY